MDNSKSNPSTDDAVKTLLKTILDDSNQLVQVSSLDSMKLLYVNKTAREYAGNQDKPYLGEYCYKYMMGLDEKCPYCPLNELNNSGISEAEIDNGEQVFAVKTKIDELNGEKVFIEYARDISEIRRSERIFRGQMDRLLKSIPQAEGIIHLDLTDDICLTATGSSVNIKCFKNCVNVNETIAKMAMFIPDKKEKEEILKSFSKEALLKAYDDGEVEINRIMNTCFDDGTVRYAKAVARLIMNPATNHLECIIYCMDISQEIKEKKESEKHLLEQFSIFNILAKNYLNVYLLYPKLDKAKILKLQGYVTTGLDKTSDKFYKYSDFYKQYVKERVAPNYQEYMYKAIGLDAIINELSNKDTYSGTYLALVDGEERAYQFRYDRLENSDEVIASFQNIDDIVSKEKEQQRTLAIALDAAEQSSKAKTMFLNNMSHDIRTPMNAIIGFTALAKENYKDQEKLKDYLNKIDVSSKHLLSLINDVLDMSKIESGNVKFEEEEVNILDVLSELNDILLPDINSKNISYTTDTSELIDKKVICDHLKLKQILLNILSNAVKFTNPGGSVSVSIKQSKGFYKDKPTYTISVKDNGIGMSDEFKKHIFEAFSRERTSTISGIQGTGLGMAITKNLVDMMGGTISVDSKENKGSEFVVTLQLQKASDNSNSKQTNNKNDSIDNENYFKGKKILLVEDNVLNQEIAKEILINAGFKVEIANDGDEAIAKIDNINNDNYDVILMDVQMPKMDGYTATKRIRSLNNEKAKNIPIIATTANAFNEDKNKAIEAGMNGHVAKPLNLNELFNVLKNVLDK